MLLGLIIFIVGMLLILILPATGINYWLYNRLPVWLYFLVSFLIIALLVATTTLGIGLILDGSIK